MTTPAERFRAELSRRLRVARERTLPPLSQAEVGRRAHMSATQVAHYENGRRSPYAENLADLAKALEVSSDYLLQLSPDFDGEH